MSWKDAPLVDDSVKSTSWQDAPLVTDSKSIVSATNTDSLVDNENFAKVKQSEYLNSRGFDATPITVTNYAKLIYGQDSSISAANKLITNQLAVIPTGPVKSTAKIKPSYLWKAFVTGMGETATRSASGIISADIASKKLEYNILQKMGINDKTLEWAISVNEKARAKVDVATETIAEQNLQDIPKEIQDKLGFKLARGSGQIPQTMLQMAAPLRIPIMAGTIGQSIDENYKAAKDAGKTEAQSLAIGIGGGVLNGLVDVATDALGLKVGKAGFRAIKESIGSGAKEVSKTVGKEVLKQQASALLSAAGEGVQSAITQGLSSGEITESDSFLKEVLTYAKTMDAKPDQIFEEALLGYFISNIQSGIAGVVEFAQTKRFEKGLVNLGLTKDEAYTFTQRLRAANNNDTQKVIIKEIDDTIKTRIGERVLQVQPKESRDVTGFNGEPLTEVDLAIMRQQPDFIESLDDSYESELLKKAVLENDSSALGEYNQRLVGIKEEPAQATEESTEQKPMSDTTINGQQVPIAEGQETPDFVINEDEIPQLNQEDENIPMEDVAPAIEILAQQARDNSKDREIITVPASVDGVPFVVGVSRRLNNQFSTLYNQEGFSKPERMEWTTITQNAVNSGIPDKISTRADEILSGKKIKTMDGKEIDYPRLSKEEVAGGLVRVSEIENEIEERYAEMNIAIKMNNDESFARIGSEIDLLVQESLKIRKAIDLSSTENARALGFLRNQMDRRSFTLMNVLNEAAKANNGKKLDAQVQQNFIKMTSEIKYLNEFIDLQEAELKKLEEQMLKDVASGVIEKERNKTKSEAQKRSIAKDRAVAEQKLRELGFNVSMGVNPEALKHISKIAISYIQEGATTLDQVVSQVKTKLPDIESRDVYLALGRSAKKDVDKIKKDINNRVAEMKKQSRLILDIEDSLKGLPLPVYGSKVKKESSAIIKILEKQLKEFSASVLQTERDPIKVDAILERIAEINSTVENYYSREKPIKIIRKKTQDLLDAEEMLGTANAELKMTEKIALLKEILAGKDTTPTPHKKKEYSSKKLNELRAELFMLEEQVRIKNEVAKESEKELNRIKKIAQERVDLIDEVLNLHRKIKTKSAKGEDVNADWKLSRKRQDQVFRIIDEINNGKSKNEKIKKIEQEDPEGYLAMLTSLKESLSAKKKAERDRKSNDAFMKKAEERLAELIDQIEGEYRIMIETTGNVRKTSGLEEQTTEAKEAIIDQNKKIDLIRIIKSGKMPAKSSNANGAKKDPFGFKAEIKALQEELHAMDWYLEMMNTANEARLLVATKKDIEQMQADLESGDLEKYATKIERSIIKNQELADAKVERFKLKKEINRQLYNLKEKDVWHLIGEVYDIARNSKLTGDMGHLWRQGAIYSSNPKIAGLDYTTKSFDVLMDKNRAIAIELKIMDDPNYYKAIASGLHLTANSADISSKEEIAIAGLLSRVPYLKVPAEAFARTQLVMLDYLRMEAFSSLMEDNPDATPDEMKQFANVVNILTGYGNLGKLQPAAGEINKVLTSANFTMSRLQAPFLLPFMLANKNYRQNKALIRHVAINTAWYHAVRSTLIGLGVLLWPEELKVGLNPAHWTRGRVIMDAGNGKSYVIDPHAGMMLAFGIILNTAMNKKNPVEETFKELAKRGNPAIASMMAIFMNKDYRGKELEGGILERTLTAVAPIIVENIEQAQREGVDLIPALASIALDFVGFGSVLVDTKDVDDESTYLQYQIDKLDTK